MTYLRIGIGGDFPDWVSCYNYLVGLGALLDDYEIEQISNVTLSTWPAATSKVVLNGHYIRFYVAWANSHQGNPTRGFVTSLSGANGRFGPINSSLSDTGSFRLENLYFRQITNTANNLVIPRADVSATMNINIYLDNVLIEGFQAGAANIVGTIIGSSQENWWVRNVKIWGCWDGLEASYGGWVGINRTRIIENVTIWNCSRYCFNIMGLSNLTNFSNCYGCGCGGGVGWQDWAGGHGVVRTVLNNCADSENSIVNFLNAQENNCLANVNENTELISIVDTNANFLRIDPGSQLYGIGTIAITNTLSIEGYNRPNIFGVASIGASEPHYDFDFVGTPLDVAIYDTVSFQPIYDEGDFTAYLWDFGDGKTSTNENSTVSYEEPGYKTVSLTAVDIAGRLATVVKTNYVRVRDYGVDFVGVPKAGYVPLKTKFTSEFEPLP